MCEKEFALRVCLAGLFILLSLNVYSQDKPKTPQLVAVQNRQYYLDHGLSFHLGYLPMNSFNKGVTIGASYTYFLNDFLGWEVLNVSYVANQDTGLQNDLENKYGANIPDAANQLDFMNFYVTTNFIYTPLYNKSLLFNNNIVYGELSFLAGGGIASYEKAQGVGLINIGSIVRFFTAPNRSFKFDLRLLIPLGSSGGSSEVNMNIALAYEIQLGDPPENFSFGDSDDFGF